MINALFRRYKFFFIIGFVILAIQFYLAYKSIKIPINNDTKQSRNSKLTKNVQKNSVRNSISLNDDEDIINSNIQQQDVAHKVNEKTSASATLLSELKFKPKCDILSDKEVVSAVQRARTQECKKQIIDIACDIKSDTFYPKVLPNTCPSGNYIANRLLGCFQDDKKHRLLPSYYSNFKESNSPKKCIQMCLQSGYLYAGVQYSTECFCGNREPSQNLKLPDPNCNMKCPSDSKSVCGGYFTMNIYETGIASKSIIHLETTINLL
jgi:protein xylosyltransferase